MKVFTIDALIPTARWGVDVVTVWAIEFYGIQARQVGPSAWNDVRAFAVDSWAEPKNPRFILVDLGSYLSSPC